MMVKLRKKYIGLYYNRKSEIRSWNVGNGIIYNQDILNVQLPTFDSRYKFYGNNIYENHLMHTSIIVKRLRLSVTLIPGDRQYRKIYRLIEILEENNYHIDVYTTKMQLDAMYVASRACKDKYDIIVAVGGDGTVNEVVNGVMPNKTRPKLAVYPAGTVNDFANYLKVPRTMKEFAEIIIKEKTTKIDVGLGGDRYFLNVAAAGLLTDVAYRVSSEAKTVLGNLHII